MTSNMDEKTETLVFTRKDTNIAKGLFIIMMLIHHLFYDYETFGNFQVSFFLLSPHQVVVLAQYFKLCIAGFSLLTFYGLTRKYMQTPRTCYTRQVIPITIKRYLTLVLSFLMVYILSVLTAIIMKEDLASLYSNGEKSWLGYGIIDAFGMADFFHTPTLNVTWWYMSFAIAIIFLFPLFYKLYDKCGAVLVAIAAILPGALNMESTYYGMCTFSMVLGIFAARVDLFSRLRAFGRGNLWVKFWKAVWCAILVAVSFQLLFYSVSASLYFGIAAISWTFISFEFISPIRGIREVFAFIGKHSMNIFLTHTFLYYYYAKDFIYSFGNGILIVIVLLVCSLLIALAIEGIKKIIHFQAIVEWAVRQIFRLYAPTCPTGWK